RRATPARLTGALVFFKESRIQGTSQAHGHVARGRAQVDDVRRGARAAGEAAFGDRVDRLGLYADRARGAHVEVEVPIGGERDVDAARRRGDEEVLRAGGLHHADAAVLDAQVGVASRVHVDEADSR